MRTESDRCPSAAALGQLLAEQLTGPELGSVETHVESCDSCQQRLERMISKTQVTPDHSGTGSEFQSRPREDFVSQLKQMPPPHLSASELAAAIEEEPVSDEPPTSNEIDRFAGRRLGQYQILETLGKGSMGVVYKALHTELGKTVALKVLPTYLTDEVGIARFKNEARAVGRLDHPNIVTAHDAGQAQGVHFLVMTFVDGIDVSRLVQRHGRFAIPDACELIRQAAVGLQHAFERGLVHRDIKPSNLMLARNGVVRVLDLGIARLGADTLVPERLTAPGMLLGTADYLAPEQWDNPHAVDTRADIYSLGCSLYHLIAGRPPFSGPRYPTLTAKMLGHVQVPASPIVQERPEVPAQLAAVLHRMLSKNPKDRFATPGEVADALQSFTAGANLIALLESGEPSAGSASGISSLALAGDTDQSAQTFTEDRSGTQGYQWPVKNFVRRYRVAIGVASVCLVLAVAFVLLATQHGSRPPIGPAKIDAMTVSQYRGESATLLGDISRTTQAIFPDDSVRVSAKLSTPAYCYLIAFNPDGTEQLCYPEDANLPAVIYPENMSAALMTVQPLPTADFRFPKDQFFEPGISGLQVFVLIASTEPLPPYAEWRVQVGRIPWQETRSYREESRWQFDGQEFSRLPTERGTRVERGAAPKEFRHLCEFLRDRPEVQAVRALAFPVSKK